MYYYEACGQSIVVYKMIHTEYVLCRANVVERLFIFRIERENGHLSNDYIHKQIDIKAHNIQ